MPSIESSVPAVLTQQTTQDSGITEADIYTAIADVLDPELDEPLVKPGFIDRVLLAGPDVPVIFKLPTYWCAPNFAYLMASDLRRKVRAKMNTRNKIGGLHHHQEITCRQGTIERQRTSYDG